MPIDLSPEAIAIAGTVALLLPTMYFLIASPTFLLRQFEDPVVSWLFRGLLSLHFRLIGIGSVFGVAAYLFDGRPGFAVALALIGVLGMAMRRWFLARLDAEIVARDAGDAEATRRMRGLHWRSMAYNATQFAVLITIVVLVFPKPV